MRVRRYSCRTGSVPTRNRWLGGLVCTGGDAWPGRERPVWTLSRQVRGRPCVRPDNNTGVAHSLFRRNPPYVRHYESVLRALAARGHQDRPRGRTARPQRMAFRPSSRSLGVPGHNFSSSRSRRRPGSSSRRDCFKRGSTRFVEPEYRGMPAFGRARSRAPIRLAPRGMDPVRTLVAPPVVRSLDLLDQPLVPPRRSSSLLHDSEADVVCSRRSWS